MLKLMKPIEIPKSIIVEYSGAKFHFRVPNDLDKFDLVTAQKTSERIRAVFNMLDKVEGVVDQHDKPISPEKIIDLLSMEQITQIMVERNNKISELEKTLEAETKNS